MPYIRKEEVRTGQVAHKLVIVIDRHLGYFEHGK